MNLDFFNRDRQNSINNFSSNFVSSFLKELNEFLKNAKNKPLFEDGLYQIDRFEGDNEVFAVSENFNTGKMVNIPKSMIPQNASDCYVLKAENGIFSIDYDETRKYVKNITPK